MLVSTEALCDSQLPFAGGGNVFGKCVCSARYYSSSKMLGTPRKGVILSFFLSSVCLERSTETCNTLHRFCIFQENDENKKSSSGNIPKHCGKLSRKLDLTLKGLCRLHQLASSIFFSTLTAGEAKKKYTEYNKLCQEALFNPSPHFPFYFSPDTSF